jgi:opacity protein-like surface antigen
MRKLFVSAIVVCGMFPSLLLAQDKVVEKRKFGLTFPNIGIIWRISDTVAFLPDINLSHGWSDLGTTGDSTNNSIGVNAALRFYLHDWKGIRFYVSPRYGYGWSNVESPFQGSTIASELRTHSVSGAWGVEYAVSDRISLFGDIGIRYSHGKTDSTTSFSSGTSSNSTGTAGTWGLIVHLK